MLQARDGTVWLGVDSRIYQFSRERRQLRSLPHRGGVTRRFLESTDGSLRVATQDGLYCLRPGTGEVVRLNQQEGQPLRAEVNAIVEAPDASVWVGSAKGLYRVAAGASELRPVDAPTGSGLANITVIGLLFDRRQTLWLDTAVTGLHRMTRWDGERATFERISERHGIVTRPFGGNLLEDERGRIWTQMHVYDPATDRLDELTAADGADLGTGWFLAHTRTMDGRLLFGGSRGILVVSPEGFDTSDYAPPLVVSEFAIDGQRQPVGRIPEGLELAPPQRGLTLTFAALDYSDPGRLRYAYRLHGFDTDWTATGADSRVASHSNLDPGDYVLHVRATNRSGLWSPHELAIRVRVQPAWWETGWFRMSLLALLAAMVYALVQLRTRHLRARQIELERTVHERTADLEKLTQALQRESAALEESSLTGPLTGPLTGLRNRRFVALHNEADAALAVREYASHASYGASLRDDAGLIFFLFQRSIRPRRPGRRRSISPMRCSTPSSWPAATAGWERSARATRPPKPSSAGCAGPSPTGRAQEIWRSSARRFHERPATARRVARASMRSVPLGRRARRKRAGPLTGSGRRRGRQGARNFRRGRADPWRRQQRR